MRDITKLHPTLQDKLKLLQQKCTEQGLKIGISECVRTVAEQDSLYAKGRTTGGSKVTNARGSTYSSMHQWGVAVDFYRNDGKGTYNDNDGFFTKVGKIGQSIGLEWGGAWKSIKDKPHFQLPNWGSGTSKLKVLYGTPTKFISTWNVTNTVPIQSTVQTPSTDLISIGKVHAKNFIGQSNTSKNIDSLTLKQLKSMVLQRGINLDYNKGLTLDGAFGSNSKSALGSHYIKQGEKQYMVTCAEILIYLNGKNPNGVELPATFDDRLVKVSGKNKITSSDFLSYIA